MLLDTLSKSLYSKNYKADQQRRDFWDLTYRTPPEYVDGIDARGNKILMMFSSCEDLADYNYRKAITVPRNHCGIIIDRYNGFVFRKEPKRAESNPNYLEIVKSADLKGNNLNTVMSTALRYAQVDGFSIVIPDNTGSRGVKTLSQAKAENAKPYVRVVRAESLINWRIVDDQIVEAVIMFEDEEGVPFVRYYSKTDIVDFATDGKKITGTIESFPHGYYDIPVVVVTPSLPTDSQIAPIAELQKDLTNKLSQKNIETAQQIFTQMAFIGDPPDTDEEGNVVDKFHGTNKIVYVGRDGQLTRIGADTNAFIALESDVDSIEKAIYRISGLVSSNPFNVGSPQSGASKAYDDAQSGDIARTLAKAIESAEISVMKMLMIANYGIDPIEVVYDKEFLLTSMSADLENLNTLLDTDVPEVLKLNAMSGFKNSHFNLSEEEEEQFKKQLIRVDESTVQ